MSEQELEKQSKVISGISTTIIVALLILLIFFWTLKFDTNKVTEDSGVMVSLGDPFSGGPNEVPVEPSYTPPTPSDNTPETQEQTDDEDAVATKKTEETKKNKPENKEVIKPKEKPVVEDDLLKNLKKSKNQNKTNPGGSGDPDKTGGDKGDPNGSKTGSSDGTGTGNNGTGSTSGNGTTGKTVSHTFGSRKLANASNTTNCGEKGTVIVDVILKPNGTITVLGINPGSNSTNQCLRNLAMDLARKSRFDAKEDSEAVEGTLTYKFSLSN